MQSEASPSAKIALYPAKVEAVFLSLQGVAYKLILVLMSNYNHAYSGYLNHILNRSPSKKTYSFGRSERFGQGKEEMQITEQPFMQANGYQYRDGSRKVPSPQRKKENRVGYDPVARREELQSSKLKRNVDDMLKNNYQNFTRSKSKSPLRVQKTQPTESVYLNEERKRQGFQKSVNITERDRSRSSKEKKNRSPSRKGGSPHRSPQKKSSPSKTYTQNLYEVDHPSKNMTINGYYPTGRELSPSGKYPISSIRNTAAHKFPQASPEKRYMYINTSSDPNGPGYYYPFSQFGPISKR